MLSLENIRMLVHTLLFLSVWSHPLSAGQCLAQPPLDEHRVAVFAAYTMWIGFELGTCILSKKPRLDMLVHHALTSVCVLIAWSQSLTCLGYVTVRSTLLCEPVVDFYFAFKNSENPRLKLAAETMMTILFPFTRIVLMSCTVMLPTLWHYASIFRVSSLMHLVSSLGLMALFSLQIMWTRKIYRGVRAKYLEFQKVVPEDVVKVDKSE